MQLSPQLITKDPILAIIVTFNPQLEHLYEFVIELSKQFSSILIIDNNSDNYTKVFNKVNLTNENCKIIFLKNTSNIGLASAQNQGAKYVLDNSYKAFCIFDQDSDIKSDYLNVLINDYNLLISKGIQVGAIGPCVVDKSSNFSYPVSIYKGMLLKRKTLKISEVAECSYIISSGSLITTKTLKEVGTKISTIPETNQPIKKVTLEMNEKINEYLIKIASVDTLADILEDVNINPNY